MTSDLRDGALSGLRDSAKSAVQAGAERVRAARSTMPLGAKPAGDLTVASLAPVGDLLVDDSTLPWPGAHQMINGARIYVRHVVTPDGAEPARAADNGAEHTATEHTGTDDTGTDDTGTDDTGTGDTVTREPALYVHGLAGSSTNWTDFGVLLSPWLDGVALDLPGFGRSGPAPRNDYSIGAFAEIVIAYLEKSGRGPVHLFGNSMGGAVSLRVAAIRPDLVRTLTLISPAVPDLRLNRKGTDAGMLLLLLPGVRTIVQRRLDSVTPEQRARGLIALCFADPSRVPPHRMAEAIESVREREHLPWGPEAFRKSLQGLVTFYVSTGRRSPWRLLSQITAPTIVVWGDQDRLVNVALAPRVARTVPGARLLVLSNVGHTAQLEDPVVVARAFLALREDAGN